MPGFVIKDLPGSIHQRLKDRRTPSQGARYGQAVIVADTSVIAYLLIQGERTEEARRVWSRDADWRAPSLWRSEFINVLVLSVRAEVLSRDDAQTTWLRATALFRGREEEPEGGAVVEEGLASGLPAYDAQFVVVARELGVILVTGERQILNACPDIAVSMAAFAGGRS